VNVLANIKSAKKRIKVIDKKTALNKARKSQIKTAIRKFENAVANGNIEDATINFKSAQKKIQQVASKGTIHKNAAARKVAKLASKLNSMNA
jgi:small subunit ribosomal protein S20